MEPCRRAVEPRPSPARRKSFQIDPRKLPGRGEPARGDPQSHRRCPRPRTKTRKAETATRRTRRKPRRHYGLEEMIDEHHLRRFKPKSTVLQIAEFLMGNSLS